ncbi:MAG: hypothetical protein ABSB56_05875 [Nitrososphaerales archaeon]
MVFFVLLFSVAILRETTGGHGFWDERFFQPLNPPNPLASELKWISQTYGNQHLILVLSGEWPNGPYPSYLEWSLYDLRIDMVSSFIYVGSLYSLINGIPSQVISTPNPLPGLTPAPINNYSNYRVLVIDNPGTIENFYQPNGVELEILHQLIPGVYALDNLTISQAQTWSRLWEYVENPNSAVPNGGYSITDLNWTAEHGVLSSEQNVIVFHLWPNVTDGWMQVEGLHLELNSFSYLVLSVNSQNGLAVSVDFYSANQFIGRWNLNTTGQGLQTLFVNVNTLGIPLDAPIWRIAVDFHATGTNATLDLVRIVLLQDPPIS